MNAMKPLRNLLLCSSCALLLFACSRSSEVPGAVLLSLRFAPDVSRADRNRIARFAVDVDGAETYRTTFMAGTVLTGDGPYTVRYRPGVTTGRLGITVEAEDGDALVIARGTASATLDAADETHVEVLLSRHVATADGATDGAVDGATDLGDSGTSLDLAVPDLSVPDLALPDLKTPDLKTPDLKVPDLTMPDLATPPDLNAPFVPSHVGADAYKPSAADLPDGVTTIDTDALRLSNESMLPIDADFFLADNGIAVLSIGEGVLGDVVVTGSHRLAIVAAGALAVKGHISVSARGTTPGPGGSATRQGAGKGGDGDRDSSGTDSGGGGAGFGNVGAAGGRGLGGLDGGAGGAAYGTPLAEFLGGSGGGNGRSCIGLSASDMGTDIAGSGGAGGGAIQLSSATRITLTASAAIEANGGGGAGGCYTSMGEDGSGGGGGGGAGGTIFLEAPAIEVRGGLYANGGGGGAGANSSSNPGSGSSGADGQNGTVAALGGPSKGNGGAGGAGGTSSDSPTTPSNASNGGGGGGSVGRIWLRTRSNPADQAGATISPAATLDMTL